MISYFIGGPMDLTKRNTDDKLDSFEFPSSDTTTWFPTGEARPSPVVKTHKYRRFLHELDNQFAMFYYEGTW